MNPPPCAVLQAPYELLRSVRQGEVDADKRASRLQAISTLDARIADYNATLKMPCHFALKL